MSQRKKEKESNLKRKKNVFVIKITRNGKHFLAKLPNTRFPGAKSLTPAAHVVDIILMKIY